MNIPCIKGRNGIDIALLFGKDSLLQNAKVDSLIMVPRIARFRPRLWDSSLLTLAWIAVHWHVASTAALRSEYPADRVQNGRSTLDRISTKLRSLTNQTILLPSVNCKDGHV